MDCTLNSIPKLNVVQSIKEADRVVASGHEIKDQKTIDGLLSIYKRLKWRPFIDTEPIGQYPIEFYRGDELLMKFDYGAGWWMEGQRKGVLNERQLEWMDKNIHDRIPEEKLPRTNIL